MMALEPLEQFNLTLASTPTVSATFVEVSVEFVVMRQPLTTVALMPSCAVAVAASEYEFGRKRLSANELTNRPASFRSVEVEELTID